MKSRGVGGATRMPRLMAGTALALVMAAAPAVAADAVQGTQVAQAAPVAQARFAIPAQPLSGALIAFGQQSGLQVVVDPAVLEGLSSPGVTGALAPADALRALLSGTGMTWRMADERTVALEKVPQEAGVLVLDPVSVNATLLGTRIGETAAEASASVRVFTGKELEADPGVQDVADIYAKTSNMIDNGPGNFAPAVRGVDSTGPANASLAFISGTRPRMTLSVDGRPLSAFELVGSSTSVWDVEQVEVYRGPQTTLQGRNSVAGAMQVKTKDPTFHWEGVAQAAIGTEDRNRESVALSGPISEDAVAFRVAVDRMDATSPLQLTGPQALSDPRSDDYVTARGKILVQPESNPDLTTRLTFTHQKTRRPQTQRSDPPFGARTRAISQTVYEIDAQSVILDVEYQLTEALKLTNSATYADIAFDRLDAPANGQFSLAGPQITNETRLNYDNEAAGVKGVLGAYLFTEDREDLLFQGTPRASAFQDQTLTTALFGEVTWEFVDRWHVTAGGRYEREQRERMGSFRGITTNLDETFEAFLPKVGLAYDVTPQATVGAVVSRGFNAGGAAVSFGAFDAGGNPSPNPAHGPRSFTYDPEYVWNYELYSRASLLDGRVALTGNVFYSRFEDQQRTERLSYPGGFTDSIITNTPRSHAYGAELGGTFAATPQLTLFADAGVLWTKITRSNDARLIGNEFERAPRFNANIGGTWRPDETWTIGVDGRYVGSYFSNDLNNPLQKVDPYFVANAKVSKQVTENVALFGSVTNIFDTDAERELWGWPLDTGAATLADVVEPRIFWVGTSVSF